MTPGLDATPEAADAAGSAQALASTHAQARQLAETGDLTGARTLIEDALTAGEWRLGRDHPRLAPLMVDLATIARNLGNLTEARTQLRRAYAIIVTSAGPEHATSLSVEGRLAAVSYRLGEPTEAYDWHLADVGARVLGTDHPAVRGAQQRLSTATQAAQTTPTQAAPTGTAPTQTATTETAPTRTAPVETAPTMAPPTRVAPTMQTAPQEPDEPGFAPMYTPAGSPGVFQRQQPAGVHVVAPPPREYEDVEVWQEPPLAAHVPERHSRRRGHGGGTALVASLGAAALVAAAVIGVQLFRPARSGPPAAANTPAPGVATTDRSVPTSAPSPTPPPPTAVAIKDEGGSVTLTWADPSDGLVPFIVSGGRDGESARPLDNVPPGRTISTIYGLNDRYNYCFTVAAVWSAAEIAPSIRTCTRRLSTAAPSSTATPLSTATAP